MKFLTLTATLVASASAFAGCPDCNCGDKYCEVKASDCLFDKFTDGGDEFTRKEARADAYLYLEHRYGSDAPDLHEKAKGLVGELFGDRKDVDNKEFYGIYSAIRHNFDGCAAEEKAIGGYDHIHFNYGGYCYSFGGEYISNGRVDEILAQRMY